MFVSFVRLPVDVDRIAFFTLSYKVLTDNSLRKISYESQDEMINCMIY